MAEILVKLHVPLGEEIVQLSILDQQAQRNYANLLIAMEVDRQGDFDDIIDHLKQGLGLALCEVPDMASRVMPVSTSKRKELELHLGPDSAVPFRTINYSNVGENSINHGSLLLRQRYSDLVHDGFPLADIPEQDLFFPRATCEDDCPQGLPALLIQINLIKGGLIVALSWHHSVCDARGINSLLSSWARHTNAYTTQGITTLPKVSGEYMSERWRLSYGSSDADIAIFPDYVVDPSARSPLSRTSPHLLDRPDHVAATATMSTWYFTIEALESLRNAIVGVDPKHKQNFTYSEAVGALIWKHLSRARLLHQRASQGTSILATRVDFRARMNPAFTEEFIGNITEPNARVRMPIHELCSPSTAQSLLLLAQSIRDAIMVLDERAVRDFIGIVEKLSAVTDLTWDYDTFPGPDLAISDMSSMDIFSLDWGGLLGRPTYVRSGSREKGLAYILPRDLDGGFEIQLQCEVEAVERLKNDEIFIQYAQFRC
ncbi:hypothetical protein ABKA04_004685 [Annulohypoxylon sp. FPYF3050]